MKTDTIVLFWSVFAALVLVCSTIAFGVTTATPKQTNCPCGDNCCQK